MKKILLAFILISKIGFGQDTKYFTKNYTFKNGEIAYMFGDNVKLREQPNTESNVLSLLKIGKKIEILERSNTTTEFDGIESPWYKVKIENKVGFVLGSLISLDRITYENLTYLISLKHDGIDLFLKTRVLENGLEFKENISPLANGEFSIKVTGNKGLDNIISIFEVDYFAEACGVNGGGMYLFYDGKDLLKAMDYTQVAESGLSWFNEKYIFPNDEDGKKGKIQYILEIGEVLEMDPDKEWIEKKITHRILKWNGKEMPTKNRVR